MVLVPISVQINVKTIEKHISDFSLKGTHAVTSPAILRLLLCYPAHKIIKVHRVLHSSILCT